MIFGAFSLFTCGAAVIVTINDTQKIDGDINNADTAQTAADIQKQEEREKARADRQKTRDAKREQKRQEKLEKRLWEDMGVYCARLFEKSANYGTKLSFHRDNKSKDGDVYQMYWSPEYFKIKNAFGAWKKSEAWCYLKQNENNKNFDVVLLRIGDMLILDRR